MERSLPEYELEGTVFIVDVLKLELAEKENPENLIKIHNLKWCPEGYILDYDKSKKTYASYETPAQDRVLHIIPHMAALDPEGMSFKYGLDIREVAGKTDHEVLTGKAALMEMQKGFCNTVEIKGQLFFVDLNIDYLIPVDAQFCSGIDLLATEPYKKSDGSGYLIPYNIQRKDIEALDLHTITQIPEGVIAVELPPLEQLDPVRYARKHDMDLEEIIAGFEPKCRIELKVTAWEDTALPAIIEKNLQQQMLAEDQEIKKGKGIR